jgi:hypothetical protein
MSKPEDAIKLIEAKMVQIEQDLRAASMSNPDQIMEGMKAVKQLSSGLLNPFEDNAIRGVFYIKGKYDGLREALRLLQGK